MSQSKVYHDTGRIDRSNILDSLKKFESIISNYQGHKYHYCDAEDKDAAAEAEGVPPLNLEDNEARPDSTARNTARSTLER